MSPCARTERRIVQVATSTMASNAAPDSLKRLDRDEREHDRGQAPWAEPAHQRDGVEPKAGPHQRDATGTIRTSVRLSTA